MKIITINIAHLCLAVLCTLTPSHLLSAEALNQADTNAQEQNRQQERLRLLRQQQEIKPDARDATDKLKESATVINDQIPDSEYPCFTIHQIELLGDAAGHLIASSLGGAGDKINLVPQAASLNRGPWANMEAELREALAAGKEVKVKIDVGYPAGGGVRPSEFFVTANIGGTIKRFPFSQ